MFNKSSPWIWKGVSATLQSGRYTLSYPRGRNKVLVWRLMPYLLKECCKSTSMRSFIWVPNKHNTSTLFWSNAGPPSTNLAQHWTKIGLMNRYINPILVQCWSTVYDAGPTLDQHWVGESCYLSFSLLLSHLSCYIPGPGGNPDHRLCYWWCTSQHVYK